jgi:hypothetical protein
MQLFLSLAVIVAGLTAVAVEPAAAVPGGCSSGGIVGACVDWGYYGNQVRADFYLNTAPDSTAYSYIVDLVVNGTYNRVGSGRLDHQGHYCCWYVTTHSAPLITYNVRTVVYVFKSNGIEYLNSSSPTITYRN